MKLERMIVVGGLVLLAVNGTVLYKQMQNDEEVLEVKHQIYKVRDTQEKVDKRVERLEKIVLVKTKQQVAMTTKELDCLAKNIYHEAGVEDRAGKIAVAQVTVNRLQEGKWGKDICKVVYSKSQFSWTLDKKKVAAKPKGELWTASVAVAKEFQAGVRVKGLETAQYYHADYIRNPAWAKAKQVAKQVGQHIFYKG